MADPYPDQSGNPPALGQVPLPPPPAPPPSPLAPAPAPAAAAAAPAPVQSPESNFANPYYVAPIGDVEASAFRQANTIGSVLSAIASQSDDNKVDPTWNPLSIIRGTMYEREYLNNFLGDVNEAQTRARIAKINSEIEDRENLAGSGWAGTVVSLGAGLLDPVMALPVVGEAAKGAGAVGLVQRTLSGAGRLAATGAIASGASEVAMQASQQTRTAEESVGNVASNTLLMGLLGGALGALSRGEVHTAAADLDKVRKDFSGAQRVDIADHDVSTPAPGAPPPPPSVAEGVLPEGARVITPERVSPPIDNAAPRPPTSTEPVRPGIDEEMEGIGTPDRSIRSTAPRLLNETASRTSAEGVALPAAEPVQHPGVDEAIDAYHGTPHEFLAVNNEKIGSGEGAQAFGPGFYVAESRGVGEWYARSVAEQHGGGEGHLYQVKVTAPRDAFIDWDSNLSQQSSTVKSALEKTGYTDDEGLTRLKADLKSSTSGRALTARLSSDGIRGVRYLDRVSRRRGAGTHNFVVFSDKDVLITHRNDEPILNHALREVGVDPATVSGIVRDKTLDVMVRDKITHPLDAYQKAVKELTDEAESRAEQKPESEPHDVGAALSEGERVGEVSPAGFERVGDAPPPAGENRVGEVPAHVFASDADRSLKTVFSSEHYDGSNVPLSNAGLAHDEIAALHDASFATHEGEMTPGQFVQYDRARAAQGVPEREPPPAAPEPIPVRASEPPSERYAALQDRVRQAVYEAGGNKWNQRVPLAGIREKLPDLSRETLDTVLREMHVKDNFHLSGSDNPRELDRMAGAREAGLDYKGEKMHFAWQSQEPAGWKESAAAPVATGDPMVDRVSADPYVAHAIAAPTIVRTHDVPYGAGPNKANDGVTNVDRHVPETDKIGKVEYDPARAVAVHEQVEKHVLNLLTAAGVPEARAYEIAHFVFAEPAERAWVEANVGPKAWKTYQAHWAKWLKPIDHENPANPPPDLYQKPYPHDDDHLAPEDRGSDKKFEQTGHRNLPELRAEAERVLGPGGGGAPAQLEQAARQTVANAHAALQASNTPLDRVADQAVTEHIEPLVDQAFPKEPAAEEKPLSERVNAETLLAFLKRLGGIKDYGGELRARNMHRLYPGVVNNKRGMPLDQAREAAAEAGYLGADTAQAATDTTVNDLLDALTQHPRYSIMDIAEVDRATQARERNRSMEQLHEAHQAIDTHIAEHGEGPVDAEWRSTAAEIMAQKGVGADTALERAAIALYHKDAEQARVHRETSDFPEVDHDLVGYPEQIHEAAPLNEGAGHEGHEGPYYGDRPRAAGDAGATRPEVQQTGAAGAQVERPGGRADEALSTDLGPEGTRQTLIPGVAPVTDADRLRAGAAQPMRGRAAAMPEGGLFDHDARLQRDLFDAGASDAEKVKALMDLDRAHAEAAGAGAPQSVGAAAADQRQLKLKNYGVPEWLKGVPYAGPGAEAVGNVLNKFSPMLRNFTSRSLNLRRATADLAETPLLFEDNKLGVPTSYGGPPLDRLIKTQSRQLQIETNHQLETAFVAYRYGDTPPKLPMQQAGLEDVAGKAGDKMSFSQFKAEVSRALYSGDKHDLPQVARAATNIRKNVIDPVAKLAQETLGPDGRPMLAEELAPPPGDESYAPRIWNKEAIAARRNEVRETFTKYLAADQATKADAKDRLVDLSARHDDLLAQQKKLDGRIATVDRRLGEVGPALKERGMETNRATDRVDTLDERNAKIDAESDELRQFLAETRSVVTAPDADPVDLQQYDDLRRDLATLQRRRARTNIRVDEAGVPVSASQSRFMDLADRQTRYQTMRDLLVRARENSETERLATRARMEDELRRWNGSSSREAKAALTAREEAERIRGLKQEAGVYAGKGERFTSADAAVDSAVRRISDSPRDLSHQELQGVADEIIDRLLGSPDGRLSYDSEPVVGPPNFGRGQELRGSLRARTFAIPSADVHDFIEHDTQHLMSAYLRSILPDVYLTRRFGDIEMREAFRKVNEDYASLGAGMTSEKDLVALERERQGGIRDLAALRDRLRGVYGWSPDPRMRNAARVAGVARNWNIIADLGTSVINRLGDAGANAVFRYGFGAVLRDSWQPMFKALTGNPTLAKAYRSQAIAMAVGVDGMLGHMAHDFGDAMENYRPGSKFERALAWGADKSMLVNMHGPWTDWTKTMVSGVASGELLRAAERVATGAVEKGDIERLAASNIDRAMAIKIWKNFSDGGGAHIEGVPVPNTRDWKDLDARTHFEAAIGREADIAVITPGMEKPLWMSGPISGLMGQFKSFVAGAYERLLISNLQQRDARTIQGLLTAVATGMLSYRLYTWLSGKPASDNAADWIKEGIHRSAILAWFSEINEMQAKFTGGATDAYRTIGATSPLTRRDQSPAGALLGPTYSRVEGLLGATGDALRAMLAHTVGGDPQKVIWTAQDTHKLREMMLLQNLAGFRILLDEMENGFNSAIGIPQRDKSGKTWNPRSSFNAIQESTPPQVQQQQAPP